MSDPKRETQFRFLLAATLSMLVLFGWTYFFPNKNLDPNNANNANSSQVANTNNAPGPAATPAPAPPEAVKLAADLSPDKTPNRETVIKTPLFQVKLDSKGAVATSWVLFKNVSTEDQAGKPLYAYGSTKDDHKPLELVSPEGLKREPRDAPFRLSTGDAALDAFVNGRNFQVSASEETIELSGDQSRQIDFVLKDEANAIEITKSFSFRADSYLSNLSVTIKKNGQTVPSAKLLIGSSIGDHGVNFYNFYQVEPEGVAQVSGSSHRIYAASVADTESKREAVPGLVDWAGIGDTYFAMAVIPAKVADGLEFTSSSYEVDIDPVYDSIFSWITRSPVTNQKRHLITAYVPIVADGSPNQIYTGTKDYFVLKQYNKTLGEMVGRPIDIEDFINYGYLSFFTKPLSVPILYALNFLHDFTYSYGISIIIFTLFFYSLLFPLRWYQSKSFKKSAANAPKMKEMQDRLKEMQKKGVPSDDPKMRQLQMEQLKMTKDALPIGGCLPMVLQFPLLIALYITVTISIGFRQASFLWLPDLSAGDPLHLLEFGFAFSMILSMKFSPTAAPVTPEQKMQQKMMTYFMPVMMLWVMWSAPAGLLLYWFFGNIVSFVQQLVINHFNKPAGPAADVTESVVLGSGKGKPKLSTS